MGTAVPDVAERLIRVYGASEEPGVRSNVLVLLRLTPEKPATLTFLRAVAIREPRNNESPEAPAIALSSLAALGANGRAIVRELHQRGMVRSPEGRARLQWLARNGYREPTSRQP